VGDIPLDAQRIVDELRASRRQASTSAPRYWIPSELFDPEITTSPRVPVQWNEHLGWMHQNWDLRELLAPPRQRGLEGFIRRLIHRAVMAVLAPYFARLQDYLGVNVRAVDLLSKSVDEDHTTQQRLIEAIRSDVVDFAHHVDELEHG
jgi:hypothetical protein